MHPHPVDCWGPSIKTTAGGKKTSATDTSLAGSVRAGVFVISIHHIPLALLVATAIAPRAMLGLSLPLAVGVGIVGLAGMLSARRRLAVASSSMILMLLFAGKTATSILKLESPDTAVLLTTFVLALAFFETSLIVLTFTEDNSRLKEREDEFSLELKIRLNTWVRNQLTHQAKFSLFALGLSIALLPVAGFTSVSTGQATFSATLALVAVVALLFLAVHRREPKKR